MSELLEVENTANVVNSDNGLLDMIGNHNHTLLRNIEEQESKDCVTEILGKLDQREAKVLKMYYGIGYPQKITLREIGEDINLSYERVRQIKDKALRKALRNIRKKGARELEDYIKK